MKQRQFFKILRFYISQIDFFFIFTAIIFMMLQIWIINNLNYPIRWGAVVLCVIWILFFKAGVDLADIALNFDKIEIAQFLDGMVQNVEIEVWRKKTLVLAGILIFSSFVPISQLIGNQTEYSGAGIGLVFSLNSILCLAASMEGVSKYSEAIHALLISFLFPYLLDILHNIIYNPFLLFTSFPFFFFLCALFIMRNLRNLMAGKKSQRPGIFILLEIRTLFPAIISLVFAGFLSQMILRLSGYGFSLLPEIFFSIAAGIVLAWNLWLTYMRNQKYFVSAHAFTHILTAIQLLMYYLKLRVN